MKPQIKLSITTALLCLGLLHPVKAQKSTNQALWYGFTIGAAINQKWNNETELMERHLIHPFQQSQFLIRTKFHNTISERSNFGFGGSIFFFHIPQTIHQSSFTLPEIRPHGEYNFRTNLGPLDLENRLRGELRFFKNTNESKTELQEGFHYGSARIRYRLQAIFPIAKFSDQKSLKLKVADELMAMAGGKFQEFTFDQNRISVDLSLSFSPLLSLDLGYVNWYQAKISGGYLEQHILRTVIKHQLKSSKK
ncbi:DUF2490 domain-containing protein [Algoriphagus sp. AK58]|uniref:DUF2490 domain-containing protein n=1 Tax=Algoriphagus sp. AK58 TaxID=1406877 RepID=UPI001650C0D5|nr:DUF2490 domain-containing protein [Algoriphagus sp. AK58]